MECCERAINPEYHVTALNPYKDQLKRYVRSSSHLKQHTIDVYDVKKDYFANRHKDCYWS